MLFGGAIDDRLRAGAAGGWGDVKPQLSGAQRTLSGLKIAGRDLRCSQFPRNELPLALHTHGCIGILGKSHASPEVDSVPPLV